MDFRAEDVVSGSRALTAEGVGIQFNRVVSEGSCFEPALGDPSCAGEDFDAFGIAPSEVELGTRRSGGFSWERVPRLEAPSAQGAPFRVLSQTADPGVTDEGGGVGFATLALGQNVAWSRGDTRRRLEHDGPPTEAWSLQWGSMVGSDLLEPLSVCVGLIGGTRRRMWPLWTNA